MSGEEKSGPMYRLVLAGDVGSGKSSFLLRLSQHQFKEDMQSTVGETITQGHIHTVHTYIDTHTSLGYMASFYKDLAC